MRAIRENANSAQKTMRRGEQEAINLRRRRLRISILRGVSVFVICVSIISSLYLWRSGQIETWINSAETKVEDSLVDAGLTVEKIDIEGELQTSVGEIMETAGIEIGQPLLAVNIKEIKERIELLNWVKTATIARKMPDGVAINIVEHQPAALWQVDNKLWILSDEGVRITDQGLEYFSDLPMISGNGADDNLEELMITVSQNMELFDRVETATWVGGRRWDLILNNGIKIMLPENGMEVAWQNLIEFERQEKLLAKNILAVDFRIQDKTVVRLTPEEAARRRLMAKTSGKGEEI
ncbi:cell division protein FtsQ/DivIB [Pseudemcibacter aquimaris]|uniref:cell division protein FtsQ/DivIB n=1 Tax=Pseudemcibacter aquimaris TaxID=2857064 RepID=UPI0020110B16|nr:FtsQ-type POTRA domain-containing protein [Pseudemcibacter aquimaris]MCC3861364.1 FtsQ-type POTRA domain-containing protein [Pseudemcibacter aquimaris]WDU58136.1 FtsQ-type POTRA domain-containing protein [Pseudemcibacter aquimaris]